MKHYHRVLGLVKLVRPVNFVLFFAGVLIGGLLYADGEPIQGDALRRLVTAMCSAALIGAGANAINDVFDIEIDRINRPNRPLPAGTVSTRTALLVWGVTSALGVAAALTLSVAHVGIAVLSVGLLYAYSAQLKRMPLWGNLAVAVTVGLAPVYGALAAGGLGLAWLASVFAFATTLIRELVKDLEDIDGDRVHGARTFPIVAGQKRTRQFALILLGLTLAGVPLPYLVFGLDGLYLLFGVLSAGALAYAAHRLTRPAASSAAMKIAMVAGLVALGVG
ncbi:MAG: geranylgeranylglycerol-phosphate geranylgeranyltransferase [Bacteroidota bacterium]